MLYCQAVDKDGKPCCGSDNVTILRESKYSVLYRCNICKYNSILIKDY